MVKIFRLGNAGSSANLDWYGSTQYPYGSTARDGIADPNGANARYEITSIPSPFARIALVEYAFREVNKSGNLGGNTIFHKMVSDTLDVGQIFFNIDNYAGLIEIIEWDRSKDLPLLSGSGDPGHRCLGDVLDIYLKADATIYNFDKMQSIYLLNLLTGPNMMNIIGATSPVTLFFSSASDLSYVKNFIVFDTDKPFDQFYQPLYNRDSAYVQYLFALRASIPTFARLFPEIDKYMNLTFQQLNQQVQTYIRGLNSNSINNFAPLRVNSGGRAFNVQVLNNVQLYKRNSAIDITKSAFLIKNTRDNSLAPLVLPVENGNAYADLYYVTANWGKDNKAPFEDGQQDLSQRRLPFCGQQSPYLTVSDLLQPELIKVEHAMDKDCYFDGNLKKVNNDMVSYLLPLKPLFFEFFKVEDLYAAMPDGAKMFEMECLAGDTIKVTLRIPIQGNRNVSYMEYSRLYYPERKSNPSKNEGAIVNFTFYEGGFVMPHLRFADEMDANYVVTSISQSKDDVYNYVFYSGGQPVTSVVNSRNKETGNVIIHTHQINGSNFDYILVSDKFNRSGVIIPKFKIQNSLNTYHFAIDLGTSNTHIEYNDGKNNTSRAFDITKTDTQVCWMFVRTIGTRGGFIDLGMAKEYVEKDFLPDEVGKGDFKFPMRTVLSSAVTTDWAGQIDPFVLANIPLTYEKRSELSHDDYTTDIKWGIGGNNDIKMKTYIRCLMLMLRNKVLLNGGTLGKTQITWFYPISMPHYRLVQLSNAWDEAYHEYFGNGQKTILMTESSAPIQYFFTTNATATSLVNVDVGGGTTDIAFAKNRQVECVTSFRFGANVLFEDQYAPSNTHNGIVDSHKEAIKTLFADRGSASELFDVYNKLLNKPADMASFLFSLADNGLIKDAKINRDQIDFNRVLQGDDNFKIVFVLFYTAIIYHIGLIIKVQGLDFPRHISFSGNGSKVIRIITTDDKLLASYTKSVLEFVVGKPYDKELELVGLDGKSNPKEATCKGGLLSTSAPSYKEPALVLNAAATGFVGNNDTYGSISEDDKSKVVDAVDEFFGFTLDEMNHKFNFADAFGVSKEALSIAKEVSKKDLATFLDKGISSLSCETSKDDVIGEPLFFYPIKGVLNAITTQIYNSLHKS